MRESDDLQFLDDATLVPFAELVAASGLAMEQLLELVEHGVLEPARAAEHAHAHAPAGWLVTSHSLHVARRAARLQQDFGLDAGGVALVLSLLDRIDVLERRLQELECQLPR